MPWAVVSVPGQLVCPHERLRRRNVQVIAKKMINTVDLRNYYTILLRYWQGSSAATGHKSA